MMSATGDAPEYYTNGNGGNLRYTTGIQGYSGNPIPYGPTVHSSGSNYLFADGHAKFLPFTSVSYGPNSQQPNNPAFLGTNPSAAGTGDSTGNYTGTFSVY